MTPLRSPVQCTIPCHTLGLPAPTGRERYLLCPPRMVMRPPVWLQCEMLQAVRGAAALRRRQSSNIARFSIAHKNRDFLIPKIPVARRRPGAGELQRAQVGHKYWLSWAVVGTTPNRLCGLARLVTCFVAILAEKISKIGLNFQ